MMLFNFLFSLIKTKKYNFHRIVPPMYFVDIDPRVIRNLMHNNQTGSTLILSILHN